MTQTSTARRIAVTAAVLLTTGLIGSPALAKKQTGVVDPGPGTTHARAVHPDRAPGGLRKAYP
jgi:hypothetical protein